MCRESDRFFTPFAKSLDRSLKAQRKSERSVAKTRARASYFLSRMFFCPESVMPEANLSNSYNPLESYLRWIS